MIHTHGYRAGYEFAAIHTTSSPGQVTDHWSFEGPDRSIFEVGKFRILGRVDTYQTMLRANTRNT